MIYLIIAILCGALFAVVFKICQQHGISTSKVILYNYITGVLISWIPILINVCSSGGNTWASYQLEPSSYLLAMIQGGFFTCGFLVMDTSTYRSGVALTTAAARASLILPVILSWAILSQKEPKWLPVILVLVALMFIILPNEQQKHDPTQYRSKSDAARRRKAAFALAGVFLFYGVSDFSMKIVQQQVVPSADDSCRLNALTGTIFLMAALISLAICIFSKPKPTKEQLANKHPILSAIIAGVILGAINLGCTSCMIRSLSELSTGVYYPIYNIGIVILSTIIGLAFFKEKIKWLQILGLIIAIIAILLFFA